MALLLELLAAGVISRRTSSRSLVAALSRFKERRAGTIKPRCHFSRIGSKPDVPVFSRCHARQGGFQILKRPFSERTNTIPHLTQRDIRGYA